MVDRFSAPFDGVECLYTVQEISATNLWKVFVRQPAECRVLLPQHVPQHYLLGIVRGVGHLHSLDIAHGDLSLANVLLTWNQSVRIADMGTGHCCHSYLSPVPLCHAYIRPPEVVAGNPKHGWPVDSWAVGVIALTMFSQELPFLIDVSQLSSDTSRSRADVLAEEHAFLTAASLLESIDDSTWPGHTTLKKWPSLATKYKAVSPKGTLAHFMSVRPRRMPLGERVDESKHIVDMLLRWDRNARATMWSIEETLLRNFKFPQQSATGVAAPPGAFVAQQKVGQPWFSGHSSVAKETSMARHVSTPGVVGNSSKKAPPLGAATNAGALSERRALRPPLPSGLYCERQARGSETCAVHAVNHALQRHAFTVEQFKELQLATARDLLEIPSLHGHRHRKGDWSVEVIGRALRQEGFRLRMVPDWSTTPRQAVLAGADGLILGSGAHWTALVRMGDCTVHFDSLVRAPASVARVVTSLAPFVDHRAFQVIRDRNVHRDDFTDTETAERARAIYAAEWRGVGPGRGETRPTVSSESSKMEAVVLD